MDPKGAVAKVHAVRSKTYPVQQCRLSEEVANALGLSKACPETSLRAFRVTATCVSSGPDARHEEFYLFWLGDIISHSDGVEVSQTLLNDYSLKENSTVHISEVPHVSAAIDVRLEPLSKFDWDVASTQASKIENTLLRDVSIVAVDTILTAHVSPSLKAKFKVSHIATNNSSVQSSEVARLTNSTSLIISPYIDTHVDSSQYEETGRQFDSLDLPTLLAKLSANLHLRVMPACHNSQITGYMANRSSHSDRRAATTNDILDSLTSTPIVPSTPAKSPSNSYVWTNKGIDEHDINTVYIHPIVLKTCLEVMVARTVSADELQDIMIKHMYTTWICALTPVIPTNMVSIARKVVFTDYVRPYYVVIPSCIRKSLGSIGDYDKIQTAICIRSQCVLPTAIRLCPLYNRDKMGDMVEDPETTRSTNAGVVDGLVRFIDTHSSVHSPCMLSHNQIISLNASQDGGKITVQDYAVQLDVQHTSTSDSLRHVMLSLLDQSDLLYQLLLVITVDHHHPQHTLTKSSSLSAKLTEGDAPFAEVRAVFASLLRRSLLTLLPCLLPSAIEATIHAGICPINFIMLTGRSGSGKTTLLRSLSKHFQALPNVMTQYGHVDCMSLKDLPVDRLLSALTQAFQIAKDNSPYLLCLDNLDVLVKSSREGGLIKDEKALLVSMHISRHLHEMRYLLVKGFQKAKYILQSIDPNLQDDNMFIRCSAIHKALEGSVVVLASALSLDDMDSVLFGPNRFQHVLSIPLLPEGCRYATVLNILKASHVSIDRLFSYEEIASISRYTEGFVIGDLVCLCNSLRAQAYNRAFARVKGQVLAALHDPNLIGDMCIDQYATVSFDDLYNQLRNFSGTATTSSYSDPSDLSWSDIGGYEELKQSILDMLRNPVLYKRLYCKIPMKLPKAILLYGMPGTGKTHLAKAAGREFGMGFLCVRGPQLLDKYIGASEKAVRELFIKAQDMNRPVLIFFDEFEALAARRGKDNTGITDRVVNQLLTFIDGVDSVNQNKDIYIIAATSRPELVDPALLRPGRIDKHIYVKLPDEEDRRGILYAHLRTCALVDCDGDTASVDALNGLKAAIQELARATKGMAAADLKSLVNTAYLHAVHDLIDHGQSSTTKVCLQPSHLLRALQDTKASLSSEDIGMYESIYRVFRGQGNKEANKDAVNKVNGGGNGNGLDGDGVHSEQLDTYKIFKQQRFSYK